MANTLDNVMTTLLAAGQLALREMAVTPRLVNRRYETDPGTQSDTISVPIPASMTPTDVTPGPTPPAGQDLEPGSVAIALDQWKEQRFHLTDKEFSEIDPKAGYIPMQVSEAIRGLANNVDRYVLNLGKKFYGVQGTAGTTPFQTSIADAAQIRKVLNQQLAPLDDRYLVMDPDAEAEALELRAFHDASFGVGSAPILDGQIGRRLGFTWAMNQNVQTHTAGAAANYLVNNASGYAVGSKTLAIGTGSGAFNVGDIITFSTHAQTYVVTASVGGASATSVSIEPGLVTTVANNVAITAGGDTGGIGSHVMNLAFQRNAIALVSKPLAGSQHPGAIIRSTVDPVSGLALRLEFSREHKRDAWSFDVLYGAEVIRRELGARLLG